MEGEVGARGCKERCKEGAALSALRCAAVCAAVRCPATAKKLSLTLDRTFRGHCNDGTFYSDIF